MDKKFDFKTIAIACLLFFGFVFLLFYKFSSADDVINHYKTALEIFSDQQSFEDFKSTLPNKILPEWYTEEESLTNLLNTIACFAMGDYIQVSENLVSELSGQITGDPLFLEHFVFDYDSLSWVFDSDTDDFIKSKLDPFIFTSSGPVVGGWYECPFKTDTYFASNYLRYLDFVEGPSASSPVYVCFYTGFQSGNHYVVFASFVSGQDASVNQYYSSNNGNTWQYSPTGFNLSSTYQGSESLGYFVTQNLNFFNAPYNLFPFYSGYGSQNDALADLFGWDGTISDPDSTIPGVSIRNEDFVVKPLSYPASVLVDYPNEITFPDYDPDDTRLTFEYTYNMDVPFWLKNPNTEPTSYDLPTDYDFGNIEFVYDADPSYLAGAGIIQDVFDILPSSLQGLIALFGAGSLAFIFLRR